MRHPHECDGQGWLAPELMKELITTCKTEMDVLTEQITRIEADLADLNNESMRLQKDYDEMVSWANIYVGARKE